MEFFAQGRDRALLLCARRAVLAFKGHGGVFEELLLPGVELRGLDAVQIADVGDGLVLKEVKFQNRDLFFGRKSPPRALGYGLASARITILFEKAITPISSEAGHFAVPKLFSRHQKVGIMRKTTTLVVNA